MSAPDFNVLGDAYARELDRAFAAHLGTIAAPRMPSEPEPEADKAEDCA